MTEFEPLNLVISSINLTLALAVVMIYGREAWVALASRSMPDIGGILAIGIVGSWAKEALRIVDTMVYRLSDDPVWLEWDFWNFTLFIGSLAAVAHLVAPHAVPPGFRSNSWVAFWIALAGGAALAGFLIGVQWGG